MSPPQPYRGDDRARPHRSVVLVIHGVVDADTVTGLCRRVRELLADPDIDVLTCDVSGVVDPDVSHLDALARMQLTAQRMGRSIRLRHVHPDMRALLGLAGLTDIVPTMTDCGVSPDPDPETRH